MTQNPSTIAITVSHLKKAYGNVKAVEDVSFEVNEGEIFGLLGPNGAGKTTTVECITGLRHPDGGTISVLGLDPQIDRDALHPVVGVQLQFSTFPDKLKVSEILDMYQSFYPQSGKSGRAGSVRLASARNWAATTKHFPAARSNECRSLWRLLASRRLPCWTR